MPTDKRSEARLLRAGGQTLQQIGTALGVSKERARQLLLPTTSLKVRPCKGCGKPIGVPRVQYHPTCRPVPSLLPPACPTCGAKFKRTGGRQVYCSPACRPNFGLAGDESGRGRKRTSLRGRKFDRWTVLDAPPTRTGRHLLWSCRCSCGTEGLVPADKLLAGTSTRCRRCTLGATWEKTCPTCGREYLGTTRQVYCSPACRPSGGDS